MFYEAYTRVDFLVDIAARLTLEIIDRLNGNSIRSGDASDTTVRLNRSV